MTEIKIFSGRSHPELAERICAELKIELSQKEIKPHETKPYANGCFEVILRDRVWECSVFLVQTSVSQTLHRDIWELFQMISAAEENLANKITVIMPYVSYARSDKERGDEKYIRGMAVAGKFLIKLLHASGATRFIGIDFHSKAFERFFAGSCKELPMSFYHLSALPLFVDYLKTKRIIDGSVIASDDGALDKAVLLAKKLDFPVSVAIKKRIDDKTVVIENVAGEISGKDVILWDDEISVGTTIKALGEKLQELSAKSLTVVATHGLFVGNAIENLESPSILKEIIVTDTVPLRSEVKESLPVRVVSVASLIAKKIKEISNEV